jgi:hypothetical protein
MMNKNFLWNPSLKIYAITQQPRLICMLMKLLIKHEWKVVDMLRKVSRAHFNYKSVYSNQLSSFTSRSFAYSN